ncbi:hypothetical protein [Microbacterium album]|uniref:IPT/TIG domain-containing protein n=1 Tax=Microbacterium album TaxID=2053191 RepID=A0A917MP19_9MICO|nr:hypothetical protein [Microbacterium album]GGH51357.1 hypothetical protein GCM10010921_30720 [Microbacterium album]
MKPLARAALALTALAALSVPAFVAAPPAHAAAGVSVVGPSGGATADPDYATEVTVSGSGFQSIPKGFGGVYVLFGWAGDGWRPSQGGITGEHYRYVPDTEALDNNGFQRFVAFPGSDTAGAAHAIMAEDGSWSVSMVIPGATFQSRDRNGNVSEVDCREVTCGIITIGAHGVKNANNETFTPIRFAAPSGGGAAPAAGDAPAGDDEGTAAVIGDARLGLAKPAVRAGTSIVFTGQGFQPGEQVVAALDDGVTAIGPLTVGTHGDVAGALPVPGDSRNGTHVISLTGASSGLVAQSEVTVEGGTALAAAPDEPAEAPRWLIVAMLAAIAASAILVIASAITSIRRAAARRKAKRQAAGPAEPAPAAPTAPAHPAALAAPSAPSAPVAAVDAHRDAAATEVLTPAGGPR